jgi:hypothetical protein
MENISLIKEWEKNSLSAEIYHTMKWLLVRSWTILFKESLVKGRISRGEYILAFLLFTLLGELFIGMISWIHVWLAYVINFLTIIYPFSFMIRRAHDINKSWKFPLMPYIVLLVFGALFSILAWWNISSELLWIIVLVWGIWVIYMWCMLLFKKWTTWANIYWEDPLKKQPNKNIAYWLLAIILLIFILLISFYAINPALFTFTYQDF